MTIGLIALLLAGPALAADRPAYAPKRLALVRQVASVDAAPNGDEAFFVTDITGAMELWKVPANGGWPTQLSDLGEQVSSVDISPNGKEIILASDYGGDERPDLFLIPTEGGPVENITKSTRAESSPAYSPDGRRLAFIADPAEPFVFNLFVMDLATRQERQLTRENINVFFPVWSPDGKLIAATRTGDDRAGDLVLAAADGSMIEYGEPPVKGGIVIPQDWAPDGKSLLTVARRAFTACI
jgi:Tol biopolymer transport system component